MKKAHAILKKKTIRDDSKKHDKVNQLKDPQYFLFTLLSGRSCSQEQLPTNEEQKIYINKPALLLIGGTNLKLYLTWPLCLTWALSGLSPGVNC